MKDINQYELFEKISDLDYHFLEVSNNLNNYEESYVVQVVFDYFRRNGFPHYKIQDGEKLMQMDKLIAFNELSLLDGDKINSSAVLESIEDTCIDLMNYANMLMVLKKGKWGR